MHVPTYLLALHDFRPLYNNPHITEGTKNYTTVLACFETYISSKYPLGEDKFLPITKDGLGEFATISGGG